MVARRFAALAVASVALVVIAALVPMPDELRSALAIAALCAYAYFGGRAMQCWQGRGQPSLRRPALRRRFLNEKRDEVEQPRSEVAARKRQRQDGVT